MRVVQQVFLLVLIELLPMEVDLPTSLTIHAAFAVLAHLWSEAGCAYARRHDQSFNQESKNANCSPAEVPPSPFSSNHQELDRTMVCTYIYSNVNTLRLQCTAPHSCRFSAADH